MTVLLLVGCSEKQSQPQVETNHEVKEDVAQQIGTETEAVNENIKANLVILENQPHFTTPEAQNLLASFIEKYPTIEKGKVDVIPVVAKNEGETVAALILIRNGLDKSITAEDLNGAVLSLFSVYGEKTVENTLDLIPEHVGELKTGEVRALRYDFPKDGIIEDYDYTKGVTAELSGMN